MKKNLFKTVIAIITFLVGTGDVKAQRLSDSQTSLYLSDSKIAKILLSPTRNDRQQDEINPKALKHFSSSYKNIAAESWYKITDGYSARFDEDGVGATIFYDNKGRWFGSLKNYPEDKMPVRIRSIIKSTYYDYNILYMQEVETQQSKHLPTYIVCIEDRDTIKFLRMFDGELEVWKGFLKTK